MGVSIPRGPLFSGHPPRDWFVLCVHRSFIVFISNLIHFDRPRAEAYKSCPTYGHLPQFANMGSWVRTIHCAFGFATRAQLSQTSWHLFTQSIYLLVATTSAAIIAFTCGAEPARQRKLPLALLKAVKRTQYVCDGNAKCAKVVRWDAAERYVLSGSSLMDQANLKCALKVCRTSVAKIIQPFSILQCLWSV